MAYSETMNKALVRLMAGFKDFKEKYFNDDDPTSIYHRLAATGQSPKTIIIGCSDSRVDPAIMTGAGPGELFVVRNVANLVPPCEHSATGRHGTSSALEFAVLSLKVENIIVMGHRQCGGIRALMQGATEHRDSFIGQWMSVANEARDKVLHDHPHADEETQWRFAELESIKVSIRNLHSFPFVREAIESRQMNVVGLYFDLEQGQLLEYDGAHDDFRPLEV